MQYVRECVVCEQKKPGHTLLARLLQPLLIPEHKWESISMDFIMGLSKVNGKDCIIMVVDRLTKYAHFFAISSDFRPHKLSSCFLEKYFVCTGYPEPLLVFGMSDSSVSSG